jgi:hypothetical protein
MTVLFRSHPCPACGRTHNIQAQGPIDGRTAAEYEVVCPETGRRVQVQIADPGEEVAVAPQGAVLLEKAHSG